MRFYADPGVEGKSAAIIGNTGVDWSNKIGETKIGTIFRFLGLLPEEVQGSKILDYNIISDTCGGPDAADGFRLQPVFGDDFIEHGIGIAK